MDNTFNDNEKLYRAVYPPEIAKMFWKLDGSLSSAAFADPKGLSVDRGNYRSDKDVFIDMRTRFSGYIFYLYAFHCYETKALIKYLPSRHNPYHSKIHGSAARPLLSKSQRRYLAEKAVRLV